MAQTIYITFHRFNPVGKHNELTQQMVDDYNNDKLDIIRIDNALNVSVPFVSENEAWDGKLWRLAY